MPNERDDLIREAVRLLELGREKASERERSIPIAPGTMRQVRLRAATGNGLLGREGTELAAQLAASLCDSYSVNVQHWSTTTARADYLADWTVTIRPPTIDEDVPRWVTFSIVLPAIESYLLRLRALGEADGALALQVAKELVTACSRERLLYEVSIPVAGFETDVPVVEAEGLTLRRMSHWDRAAYGPFGARTHTGESLGHDMELFLRLSMSAEPTHRLEIGVPFDRTDHPPEPPDIARPVVLAFFIHGYQLAGPGVLTAHLSPEWLSVVNRWDHAPVAPRTSLSVADHLTAQKLGEIAATARWIDAQGVTEPANSHGLALHRALLGATREDPIDSLLDFVIALEALLLPFDPDTRHGDLAYRFRLHGALYLSESIDERARTSATLKTLYDLRSRAVHGNGYPSSDDTSAAVSDAASLVRRGLLRTLKDGFPTPNDFRVLALGL